MAPRAREVEPQVTAVPGTEDQLVGRRFIRLIEEQLRHLHRQPAHANRQVFYDQVVIAHLLAFFNPNLRGLRGLEDAFDDPRVRRYYEVPHLPKSTLSDAQRVFDPQLLLPILRSLQERAGIQPHDARLDALTCKILAIDGTFFTVAARIVWAVFNGSGKGNVRLHTQFNVLLGLPEQVSLTDGQATETGQLRRHLAANCLYLEDRGFQDYQLCADIIHAGSDFVVRLRQSARAQIREELPLSTADVAAGVRQDACVQLGWRRDRAPELPPLRRVEIAVTNRQGETETLILLTNRFDLPAHLIALLYQHRWQVELFFRWLKCMAHFEHFFSESLTGMTLQVYVTMIGLLLIAIETGAKPSKYDYALMSFVASGQMSMDSALKIAAKRRAERQRAAAWQKAYNARKKASR